MVVPLGKNGDAVAYEVKLSILQSSVEGDFLTDIQYLVKGGGVEIAGAKRYEEAENKDGSKLKTALLALSGVLAELGVHAEVKEMEIGE